MDINEILNMDPKSECKIHYDATEDWKNCYYQYKNESNADVDPNKLPVLDDEYLHDTGEPLFNDKYEAVYDPTQEIHYELYYGLGYQQVYSSKTFIGLFQKKIKELIKSGELEADDDGDFEMYELKEALGAYHGRGFVDEITYGVGCKDLVYIEDSEDDKLLWFTSSQLDLESGEIWIEEIKK